MYQQAETSDYQRLTPIMEQLFRHLAEYISETVEDYEIRVQLALNVIDRDRCSLQFADSRLYDAMYDAISEYIADNELDINPDDIDIETLMFNY